MSSPAIPVACFAPALTDEKLASYEKTIATLPHSAAKSAMEACLVCVKAWWELPESKRSPSARWEFVRPEGKKATCPEVPLEPDHVAALDAVTPWSYECDAMAKIFDEIPVDDTSRDVAFHLLWYAMEITRDREPMSQDKLIEE